MHTLETYQIMTLEKEASLIIEIFSPILLSKQDNFKSWLGMREVSVMVLI